MSCRICGDALRPGDRVLIAYRGGEACAYKGTARYVALCWIPETDELWWSENGESVPGNPAPLLLLCSHPFTAAAVTAYVSRVAPAAGGRRCLLIDRDRRAPRLGGRSTN